MKKVALLAILVVGLVSIGSLAAETYRLKTINLPEAGIKITFPIALGEKDPVIDKKLYNENSNGALARIVFDPSMSMLHKQLFSDIYIHTIKSSAKFYSWYQKWLKNSIHLSCDDCSFVEQFYYSPTQIKKQMQAFSKKAPYNDGSEYLGKPYNFNYSTISGRGYLSKYRYNEIGGQCEILNITFIKDKRITFLQTYSSFGEKDFSPEDELGFCRKRIPLLNKALAQIKVE